MDGIVYGCTQGPEIGLHFFFPQGLCNRTVLRRRDLREKSFPERQNTDQNRLPVYEEAHARRCGAYVKHEAVIDGPTLIDNGGGQRRTPHIQNIGYYSEWLKHCKKFHNGFFCRRGRQNPGAIGTIRSHKIGYKLFNGQGDQRFHFKGKGLSDLLGVLERHGQISEENGLIRDLYYKSVALGNLRLPKELSDFPPV